jgi:cell division protein FtsB
MIAAMEPPGITRHRRPFLAPLWVTLLALLIAAGFVYTLYRGAATTVVVLASSGEKEPGTRSSSLTSYI